MEALVAGAVIGFSVAAPPGPNAMVCISRTLAGGRSAGLRCGLGAASAHAVYATVAVLGVGRVSGLFTAGHGAIRVLGGLVLVGLGSWFGLKSPPWGGTSSPPRAFSVTLLVGLVNPLTLLYFAAALSLSAVPDRGGALVVTGVFAGSTMWWTLLASGVAAVGNRLDERWLVLAGRLAAGAIVGSGVLAVLTAF